MPGSCASPPLAVSEIGDLKMVQDLDQELAGSSAHVRDVSKSKLIGFSICYLKLRYVQLAHLA